MIFAIALVLGIINVVYGIAELIAWTGRELSLGIPLSGDPFVGIALLTVGAIYITGFKKYTERNSRAVAYPYAGSLLGTGLGIVGAFMMLSDALNAYVIEGTSWNPVESVTTYFVLGLLSAAFYMFIKNPRHGASPGGGA
ncbi:hypothetical protein [Thermococcus indicus]|uniref:hypothetical protein n=1 Tax=Thermococcus indicus TaxID=2586643 RepID=UPI00143D6D1A|nr:hypothetical protein [Thermococcus indicus]